MGSSSHVPAGYQPGDQSGMDKQYAGLVNQGAPLAQNLAQQVQTGTLGAAQSTASNPFYQGAMTGAQQAAYAAPTIAQNQYNAGSSLQGLGDQAAGNASMGLQAGQNTYGQAQALMPSILGGYADNAAYLKGAASPVAQAGYQGYGQTQSLLPGATQGGMAASLPVMLDALQKGQISWDQMQQAIPGLTGGMGAANQVLQTGFDPQNALYDRNYQQNQDQTNARNAMYGLGGSAAGAGVAGDASRNFNLDWQDRQLGRQTQALGAYGQEQGQVANNLANLSNAGTNQYNTLTNSGVGNYNALTGGAVSNATNLINSGMGALNTGFGAQNSAAVNQNYALGGMVDAFGNLSNTGMNALGAGANMAQGAGNVYGQAANMGLGGMNTTQAGANMPNQTFLNQMNAQLAAYQAAAQGGAQSFQPLTGMASAAGDYLGLGQKATQNAIQAQQANNATSGGFGQMLGQVAGTAAMMFL